MIKRLSTFVLASTVLSLAAPAFAQTTLAELDASKVAAETVVEVSSPIDYGVYDTLMDRAAVNQGGRPRVAYDFLREQEVDYVSDYVSFLEKQDLSELSEDDKLAYWLNVQNIVTVQAILQGGKKTKKGLKKLRGTADAPGKLWTQPRVTIAGQEMSLKDIETKLLTDFDNPNVIYGIYQGVRGGPCLMRKAYRGANVNEVLVENAKQYVNSNGIVSVARNNVVSLTPVFLWYKDTVFKGDDAVLLAHLKDNAEPNLKSALYRGKSFEATSLNYRLDYYDVDKATADRLASSRAASQSTSRPAPRRAPPQQQQRPRGGGGYGS